MSISLLLITFAVFSVASFPSCFSNDQQYEECRLPLRCGSGPSVFPNITYPFWGNNIGKPNFCGQTEYELSCKENQNLTLEIKNLTLRVVSANLSDKTITVADESLLEGVCPKIWKFNGDNWFGLSPKTQKIDLFDCPLSSSLPTISCQESNGSRRIYHVFRSSDPPRSCSKVGEIPMLESAKNALLQSNDSNQALKIALEKGFELRYSIQDNICRDCTDSSGICGSESGSGNFRCLCADKPHRSSCNNNDNSEGLSARAEAGAYHFPSYSFKQPNIP
uniref:non-specific serine/threonine protein kinase n=2 Tax=Noccaea caerulescens TaxID=107243 RepID=A0A1J3D113_NOCCA